MTSVRGRPVGDISVRRHSAFREPALIEGHPEWRRRVVLLVHGFANSEKAAARAYAQMLEHLADIPEIPDPRLEGIFRFYWPGDAWVWGVSQASYPLQIRRATEAGGRLARILADLAGGHTREVVLVAHSLGSRVVLEAARVLKTLPPPVPEVVGVVLMAGAVPEGEVGTGDPFARIERVLGRPVEVVLYSGHDWVLRVAFPLGQTVRTDQLARPILPRAVGLRGGPSGRWDHGHDMAPFGHGDYWTHRSSAERVSGMFGRSPVRHLGERSLPAWLSPPEHELADPNVLDRRLPG